MELFRYVVGDEADYRLNPLKTVPLQDLLLNVRLAHGHTVIIDDRHFIHQRDLTSGLSEYVNNPRLWSPRLRIIVVSSDSVPGDEFLNFLVGYCWIPDVIYGVSGPSLCAELEEALLNPRTRFDVIPLLDSGPCAQSGPRTLVKRTKEASLDEEGAFNNYKSNVSAMEECTAGCSWRYI